MEVGGVITWLQMAAVGSSGSVSGNEGYVEATMACLEQTGEVINGQWHTHPGMRVFWSGTDENDQANTLKFAQAQVDSGIMYFLVCDGLDMKLRKVAWSGESVSYWDGGIMIGGTVTRHTNKVYGGGNWGDYYGEGYRSLNSKEFVGGIDVNLSNGKASGKSDRKVGEFRFGDEVSFEFENKVYYGDVDKVDSEHPDYLGWLEVLTYTTGQLYYVPKQLAVLIVEPTQTHNYPPVYFNGVLDDGYWYKDYEVPGGYPESTLVKEEGYEIGDVVLFQYWNMPNAVSGTVTDVWPHLESLQVMLNDGSSDFVEFSDIIQKVENFTPDFPDNELTSFSPGDTVTFNFMGEPMTGEVMGKSNSEFRNALIVKATDNHEYEVGYSSITLHVKGA